MDQDPCSAVRCVTYTLQHYTQSPSRWVRESRLHERHLYSSSTEAHLGLCEAAHARISGIYGHQPSAIDPATLQPPGGLPVWTTHGALDFGPVCVRTPAATVPATPPTCSWRWTSHRSGELGNVPPCAKALMVSGNRTVGTFCGAHGSWLRAGAARGLASSRVG